MAFPVGWNRQCKLTIQHTLVSADQTTFPVPITEACLPSEMLTAGGGNAAQSDGGDIRFSTDSLGTNQLACEIAVWSQNANPALSKAEIHVPVSILAATDVDIYVWYNAGGGLTQPGAGTTFGSQAVWDTNYKGVWHLPNGSSLTVGDSTGNANNGTNVNTATAGTGKIDGAAVFVAASSQSITAPVAGMTFDHSTPFTFEGWINPTSVTGRHTIFGRSATGVRYTVLELNGNVLRFLIGATGGVGEYNVSTSTTVSTGAWIHVAGVRNVGNIFAYINGVSVTTTEATTGDFSTSYGSASIAYDGSLARWFDGSIDEFRISNSQRSTTWLATTYNAANAPGSFTVAGTPQNPPNGSLTQAAADTETLSDSISGSYGLIPKEGFSFSDGFTGGFGIPPSETFTFSDGSSASYGLIPSDTETLSDSIALFVASSTLTQAVSDTNSLSDSQSGNFGLLPNETLSFSDTLSPLVGWKVSLSESATVYSDLILTSFYIPPAQPFFSPSNAPRIWTESQINQWANDGLGQIAQDVACVWQRESLNVTAGVSVITLPAYIRTVRRMTWRGRTLDPMSFEELQMLGPATDFVSPGNSANVETSRSKPLYYAMHPTNPWDVRLYPTPNESFVAGSVDPYSPVINEAGCCVDYYRQPDQNSTIYSVPIYILRRTVKAYVLWKAYASEGKGQDLKASQYYKVKYQFLIEKFKAINEGCFVGKKYSIDDGLLALDGFRYPRPTLGPSFERVRF